SVPEPERRDGYIQLVRPALIGELVPDHLSQRVHGVFRRIDDVVGKLADLGEQFSFLSYRLTHGLIGQRVWSAGFTIPAQQNVVIGFQKEHGNVRSPFLQFLVHSGKPVEKFPRANVNDESCPVDFLRIVTKPDESWDKLGGQVVYREVSEVLKVLERRRHPRPRNAGNDDNRNRHIEAQWAVGSRQKTVGSRQKTVGRRRQAVSSNTALKILSAAYPPSAYCFLPTADCRLPSAYCRLLFCLLPTAFLLSAFCLLSFHGSIKPKLPSVRLYRTPTLFVSPSRNTMNWSSVYAKSIAASSGVIGLTRYRR